MNLLTHMGAGMVENGTWDSSSETGNLLTQVFLKYLSRLNRLFDFPFTQELLAL